MSARHVAPVTRAGMLALLLAVLAACGVSPTASASAADRDYVVVLSRHVRHEADLANRAAARTTDAGGRDLALAVAARAASTADHLDGVLAAWRVSPADADRLFAVATADIPDVRGTPVYGCSLHGPVDDVGQIDAAAPSDVVARWAQIEMTSALEGLQLSVTAGDQIGAAARAHGASVDAMLRAVLRTIAPLLPRSDQALARAGGQPSSS